MCNNTESLMVFKVSPRGDSQNHVGLSLRLTC